MAQEKTDPDPFLAMAEAKVAAWQAVVDGYRAAKALEGIQLTDTGNGPAASGLPRTPSNASVDLPTGAFRAMGMAPAVKFYLGAVKRKQTMRQIASALKEGVLLLFPDGWDLADAYPENLRQRLTNRETKPSRKRKKKATAGSAAKSGPSQTPA